MHLVMATRLPQVQQDSHPTHDAAAAAAAAALGPPRKVKAGHQAYTPPARRAGDRNGAYDRGCAAGGLHGAVRCFDWQAGTGKGHGKG